MLSAPNEPEALSAGVARTRSGFAHADVAGVERMNITDKARTITAVRATGPSSLHLSWSEGTAADLDFGAVLADRAFAALRDPGEFAQGEVGVWGHRLAWPSGGGLGGGRLWLGTAGANG